MTVTNIATLRFISGNPIYILPSKKIIKYNSEINSNIAFDDC